MWKVFCPDCKAEYVEGHTQCADGGVDLVPELPIEPEPEYIKFEFVLSTYNPGDVAIIKSILYGEGIAYFLHGENFMQIRPLVEPARLMVDSEKVETVKELLKDLNLSIMGINLSSSKDKEENE